MAGLKTGLKNALLDDRVRSSVQGIPLRLKFLVSFAITAGLLFAVTYRWFYSYSTEQVSSVARTNLQQIKQATLQGIDGTDIEGLIKEGMPRVDGHSADLRYWRLVSWLSLIEKANSKVHLSVYEASVQYPQYRVYLGSGDGNALEAQIPDYSFKEFVRVPTSSASQLWLHDTAPIRNSQGQTVAYLAVDLLADDLRLIQQQTIVLLTVAFVSSFLLLFFVISTISALLTRQLRQLLGWAEQIAAGDYVLMSVNQSLSWMPEDELHQVTVAFQQMSEAIHQRESMLEEQVCRRTHQLEAALQFEAVVRQMIRKVLANLDEDYILTTALNDLGAAFNLLSCSIGIYDVARRQTIVHQSYGKPDQSLPATLTSSKVGLTFGFDNYPGVHESLLRGEPIVFGMLYDGCPVSILACPMIEEGKSIGDIWLFQSGDYIYSPAEINLVQQITDCCVIASRQARLHRQTCERLSESEELHLLKDDFLSTVSHELRTPITNMKMALKMIQLCPDRDRQEKYIEILKSEVQRESDLIDDLLDLQRLESGQVELELVPIELQTVLPELLNAFESRISARRLHLKLEVDADTPLISSDLSSFKRAVSELVNNACKYTPEGELIRITVDAAIAGKVQIQVTNYGVELPLVEQARIFEKFYRVVGVDRWKQGGTGLGLALIKQLVQQLGGDIAVSSENQSVCFTLTFPVDQTAIVERAVLHPATATALGA